MRIAMIPSPQPMSLLAKTSSVEKLHEIMVTEDCEAISTTLLNRLYQSTKCWMVSSTEQHRKRLSVQVKKNWFRLMISMTVVIIQFIWFASYYIGLNTAEAYTNLLSIQSDQKQSIVDNDLVQSGIIMSMSPFSLVDEVIINMSSTSDDQKQPNDTEMTTKTIQTTQVTEATDNLIDCYKLSNIKTLLNLSHPEPWPSFLWRIVLGLKLALMMIGLELVRLLDTLWEIIRKPKANEDDKNRKSFIDLSYIERNRGYK